MSKNDSFERRLNNPFFKYSKRFIDLIALNIVFILVSALSLLVLFFPGLISLHTIANNMIHDVDENPYKTFFVEIKRQWSFMWRMEVLCMSVVIIAGAIVAGDIIYKEQIAYDLIVWFSLIFVSAVSFVLITIYLNLMIFNNYMKNDTFWMMIKKSALITFKKIGWSLLNVAILASFVIVMWIIPYIIPFLSFSFYIYIIEAINRKTYTQIKIEEEKRELLPENLFLPVVVDEEKEK